MPTNYSVSRLERCYLQTQPTFGVIPSTTGTATVSASNACRFIRIGMSNNVGMLSRPDKTGTRSAQGFVGGRKVSSWNIELSTVPGATAGSKPDCDPILQGVFGQTPTLVTGTVALTSATTAAPIVVTATAHGMATGDACTITGCQNVAANGVWPVEVTDVNTFKLVGSDGSSSTAGTSGTVSKAACKYVLSDEITLFSMWSFRQSSGTLDQRVAHSCVVSEATWELGQDVSTWSASGDCAWVASSKAWAGYDIYQKGAYTGTPIGTFPAEPANPVTNGNIIPGFTGRFIVGPSGATWGATAKSYVTVRNATVRVRTENGMVRDTFGTYYAMMTEGGGRTVTISFNIYDDDSAEVQSLKAAGDSKTAQDIVVQLGTTAPGTWIFLMKNVYLASHALGDGQLRFDCSFGESQATASSLALRDEFQLIVI